MVALTFLTQNFLWDLFLQNMLFVLYTLQKKFFRLLISCIFRQTFSIFVSEICQFCINILSEGNFKQSLADDTENFSFRADGSMVNVEMWLFAESNMDVL